MIPHIRKLMLRESLTQDESFDAFNQIMSGVATPAQIGGFLVALRMKGETVDEIAGGAMSMRSHGLGITFAPGEADGLVDTCGTGGDGLATFNISTTAAFVVAGAGLRVAKHGNRAISSKSGSADVLAALGVNIDIDPTVVARCIREAHVGFMFAPKFHPAMKHAMGPRKELGVRTLFNMLGPLTNPACAQGQLIGVFSPDLTEVFAQVLRILGTRRALIVHGRDGMDELTTTTETKVSELRDGHIETYEVNPLDFIKTAACAGDLEGGDAERNAKITLGVLRGAHGPRREIVCLNAAAAIVAGGRASSLQEGWAMAETSIDSGRALQALESLIRISQEAG